MKYFLPLLALVLLGCNSGETPADENVETGEASIDSTYCSCEELIFDQPYNHFWRFERRKGYTGKCEDFYPNGQLKISKTFVEGKLHGKVFSYYDNGQLEEEKEFDMNFQTGEQITYTKKGEVKFHALYKRGTQTQVLVSRPDLLKEDPWEAAN